MCLVVIITKSTSLSSNINELSVVELLILYFLASVVPERPLELDINFKLAGVFFKHGKIIAEVKLPAPIIPTIPFADLILFVLSSIDLFKFTCCSGYISKEAIELF